MSDRWRRAPPGDHAPPVAGPSAQQLLFSLAQWHERRADIADGIKAGVVLGADDDPAVIAGDLARLDVVAFEFAAFTEGRCYSRARLLRERYGYRGEIRALGDVSTDRLAFMERCGFNAFELRDDCDPRAALAAFAELSDVYQPAADGALTIPARRGLRGA